MRKTVAVLAFFALSLSAGARPAVQTDPSFARIVVTSASYNKVKPQAVPERLSLKEVARQTIYRYFGKAQELPGASANNRGESLTERKPGCDRRPPAESIQDWAKTLPVSPEFQNTAGLFVTLSKNGKTRACWGSVYPREADLVHETVLATLGALSKEYRYKPIGSGELKDLKIQVTVVRGLEAVSNIKMINPLKDGVMVRSGGRGAVILPGEAVDAYYELVLARLKADIKPNEPCQIYKIRAEIYD